MWSASAASTTEADCDNSGRQFLSRALEAMAMHSPHFLPATALVSMVRFSVTDRFRTIFKLSFGFQYGSLTSALFNRALRRYWMLT